MDRRDRRTLTLCLLIAALASRAVPAAAVDGSGASAWGPIAPPDSTNTAALPRQPRPTWEKVVNFPHTVVFLPLKVVFLGIEAGAEEFEENPSLHRLSRLLPFRAGPALLSGGLSFGAGEGFGGNVSVDVRDFAAAHDAFKLRLSAQTAGDRRATMGLRLRRTELAWFDVGGGYRNNHNTRYYGVGPDTPEDAESFYRRETSWGGVTWQHRVAGGDFGWALTGMYSGVAAIGSGRSDDPHLSEEFASDLPPGYRRHSEGITAALELSHEDTEKLGAPGRVHRERARPEHGGLRRATVSWFEGKGNSKAAFWTWRAEAQQFLPLWHSRRALGVRAFVSRIESEGDDPVPFQRLMTNDDPDVFRGYPDERFHDLGITAASVEFRWPIWVVDNENELGADAYLFADAGQVFADFDEITRDRLTTSFGGGFRVGGHGRFVGRLEVGHSEEGTQFRLRADQLFQYEKGGLFQGRSPVPDR
jgi:hypothetical protein